MKLLVDMNLSPRWIGLLQDAGWEAVHWSAVGKVSAPDSEVMAYANSCLLYTSVAKAIATSTQVNTAVYHKVRRTRTELNIAPIPRAAGFRFARFMACREHISRTTTRVQKRF